MKRRWLWLGLLGVLAGLTLLVGWKSGLAAKTYRKLFPPPVANDLNSALVRGINGRELADPGGDGFTFLVAGHIYGGQDEADHYPDAALRSAIPDILQMAPEFVISLGDMVQYSEPGDFDLLDQTLLNPLSVPVFNLVGNHDVGNRAEYEDRYGLTYYTFQYGPARLIFLDTEKKKCTLTPEQFEMLNGAVQSALRNREIKYIFIFMHKTLFFRNEILSEQREPLASPNVWSCYGNPFWDTLDGILVSAASRKPVYLFSGDVGAWGNLTPYYERHPDVPLTMVMTGLGDTSQDNIIRVQVTDIAVDLDAIFLQDFSSPPLTNFGADFWQDVASGKIPYNP